MIVEITEVPPAFKKFEALFRPCENGVNEWFGAFHSLDEAITAAEAAGAETLLYSLWYGRIAIACAADFDWRKQWKPRMRRFEFGGDYFKGRRAVADDIGLS